MDQSVTADIKMLAPLAVITGPALVVGALAGAVAAAIGLHLIVVLSVAAVVGTLASLWLWWRAQRVVLKAMHAQPIVPGLYVSHRRFQNIVKNLCITCGMTEPDLHIADIPDAEGSVVNAASVGLGRKSVHMVLTRDALANLSRIELEAVVARQLCEIRRRRDVATTLASMALLPGCGRLVSLLVGRITDRQSVTSIDIEAVGLTRYPPALATAIEKSVASSIAGVPPAVAHLWMVAPDAGTARAGERLSAALRVDVLGEL